MDLTVHIPDDLAERLSAGDVDLGRRALEALVAQEYRAGRLSRPDLRQVLGFETGHDIDGFLKTHDIYDGLTPEELNRQAQALDERAAAANLVAQFQAFAGRHTLDGLDIKDLIREGRR